MRTTIGRKLLLWTFSGGLVFAQGTSGQQPEQNDSILSLRILPERIMLSRKAASQRFVVLATTADGLERDLTSQSTLSVDQPSIVRVDPSGQVRSLQNGEATLEARMGSLKARASIEVESAGQNRPFSFARDIGTVLTKRGCNSSACHGGVKGKAGFKLSLGTLHPREDYRWIVEGGGYQVMSTEAKGLRKPRIDLQNPEKSLLLQKPTFAIPHGGGEQLPLGSQDYQTVLQWIRAGARYEDETPVKGLGVRGIEILSGEVVLDTGGKQQLLVSARLSNGRSEDITQSARYISSNPEVVSVSSSGAVEAVSPGETSIVVRAPGFVASTRVGVIRGLVSDYPQATATNYIDDHIFSKLRRFHILPSEPTSDEEFVRRVCLDLTGTLPPPHRVREFLADPDPRKREQLVDILLASVEYTDYWTFRLADLFRVGQTPTGMAEHGYIYWHWVRDSVAANKPLDQIARERITAQGYGGASRHFLNNGVVPRPEDAMAEQVRVFLGRRLDCAQCHDHPYESWSQDQFWGLAAFFKRVTRTEWTAFGPSVIYDDPNGPDPDFGAPADSARAIHPRTGQEVAPSLPDGIPVAAHEQTSPRHTFAQWITNHPYFAEAAVNRVWGYLFGRGLVDPVDDFRSSNPPSHPRLLESLAADLKQNGYDLRQLLKRIVTSRTYQLSSTPHPGYEDNLINFAHYVPKPLDAEILLDAVTTVTGVPETFESSDGGMAPSGTRAVQLSMPDIYPSPFLDMYGRPTREQIPERRVEPSLNQALHLLVGSTYSEKLAGQGGRLERLLRPGKADAEVIEELYLAAFSRFPREEELGALVKLIRQGASRQEAFANLTWALLASREFAYNH